MQFTWKILKYLQVLPHLLCLSTDSFDVFAESIDKIINELYISTKLSTKFELTRFQPKQKAYLQELNDTHHEIPYFLFIQLT